MTEHAITALNDPSDTRGHVLNIEDPPSVATVRSERQRIDRLRTQIEETTGLTAADFMAALRGL
jgi:phosphate uptake regulator